MKETEVAKHTVEFLQCDKWDVYQEVQFGQAERIPDIIGVRNKIVWIVECKSSLNFDVIAQARHWRYWVHYVSVAVPSSNRATNRGRDLAMEYLENGHGMYKYVFWRYENSYI